MKNLFKWLFQFTGLDNICIIAKVVLNLIVLALVAGLLYLVYSGFMGAWQYIAQKEPQTKQKIETLYSDLFLKDDSLKTANNQVIILSNESLKKDSVIFDQSELLKTKDSQILQHQKNNLELKKQNQEFKEFGACFVPYKVKIKEGFLNYRTETRWRNIKCDSLKFE
jgi:hypothetical protein